MPISALPTPPSRQDPTNFASRSDAFLAALPAFTTQANELATEVSLMESDTLSFMNQAQAAAAAAATVSGVARWVTGTTYAQHAVVYSPADFKTYRKKTASSVSTVDPSADATNWALVAGMGNVSFDASGFLAIGPSAALRPLHISSATEASILLERTANPANQKLWRLASNASTFSLDAGNDGLTASESAYVINRSGIAIVDHNWFTGGVRRASVTSQGLLIPSTSALTVGTDTFGTEKLNVSGSIRLTSSSTGFAAGLEGASVDFVPGSTVRIGHVTGAAGVARSITFITANNQIAQISPSGSMILATAGLSPWGYGKAYEVGDTYSGAFVSQAIDVDNYPVSLVSNAYTTSAATWARKSAQSTPARYEMLAGSHSWSNSTTGTPASAITWTPRMFLSANGNLGIGTTTPDNFFGSARRIAIDNAQNAITSILVANSSVGASVGSAYGLATGTANSNVFLTLNDANGSPQFNVNLGTAVTDFNVSLSGTTRLSTTAIATTVTGNLVVSGNATIGGIDVGYRSLPVVSTAGTTAALADRGKAYFSTGTITIPGNVFAAGDSFVIYNNSAATINIALGAGLTTLRIAGTATAGARTLLQRGIATVMFVSATEAVISGAGVA